MSTKKEIIELVKINGEKELIKALEVLKEQGNTYDEEELNIEINKIISRTNEYVLFLRTYKNIVVAVDPDNLKMFLKYTS